MGRAHVRLTFGVRYLEYRILHWTQALTTRRRLPNHQLLDLQKENQREDYFYSLILPFVPFRDERNLKVE